MIERDINDVWAYITDLSTMDNWVVGISNTHLQSGADGEVGAVYAFDYEHNGDQVPMAVKITALDPPNLIKMNSLNGPFSYETEMQLSPGNRSTHITNIIKPGSDGLFTMVMFTVFKPVLAHCFYL